MTKHVFGCKTSANVNIRSYFLSPMFFVRALPRLWHAFCPLKRSSAYNKFSQQSPEWFDSIGMAKFTPKFGDLPFVQLTTTCTTVNIIESAVEKALLPLSLLCWTIPVLAHWRCESVKPRFSCCSARCSHQSHSVSVSTSSKKGNYFLYRHLALSLPELPRTTPMPPDLH